MKSVASSSDKSLSVHKNIFSHKRYFINNLDSYHGEQILKEMAKVHERNVLSSPKLSSRTVIGEDVKVATPPPPEQPYEIIGTVSDLKVKNINHVSRILSKNECSLQMLTCGTVILDISYERDELRIAMEYLKGVYLCAMTANVLPAVLKALLEKQKPPPKDSDSDEPPVSPTTNTETNKRYLILISTVMTWGCTKPLDPDNPEMPFIEMDFRKRKPHPNYKMHFDVENEVIGIARKYRSQIGAIVIASGVTYGGREDVLYYWFQKAWECEPTLPILGRGTNAVPLINVADLAKIVYNLAMDFPKKLYILAVEQNITKQREIIKALGRNIGSGMFKCIPPEDAFLIPEIDQRIYDLMMLNMNMEPTFIVETMGLQWTSELTFVENIPILAKRFMKERGLKSFKVIIYGPPIVGKTTLAKRISETYGLIYISPETIAQDMLDDLAWRIHHWEVGETAALASPTGEEDDPAIIDDNDDIVDEGLQEAARQTLTILESGRPLSDEEILGYVRQRMLSREAINRGWVLDGFPINLAQCSALFEKGEEQDSEVEVEVQHEPFEEDVDLYNNVLKKLLPDIVVSLEATDDFICEKAMRQPGNDYRFDEETILKRLSDFRSTDSREVTPLNFFDELDIHPLVELVKKHEDYNMKETYKNVTLPMGRPCSYGKLSALIEAAEKKENRERELLKAKEAKAREELERKLKEEREEKMEYWTELYALLQEEEESALAAAGEPMRNYLVQQIFPTLTLGLLEVAKVRPEDPIDFLAEYLFKFNASGKMLEPGYNLQAEKLLGKIKILDDAIKDLDIQIEPLLPDLDDKEETKKAPVNLNVMSAL